MSFERGARKKSFFNFVESKSESRHKQFGNGMMDCLLEGKCTPHHSQNEGEKENSKGKSLKGRMKSENQVGKKK